MGIFSDVNIFFLGIRSYAKTIIDTAKHFEKKVSDTLNDNQEWVVSIHEFFDYIANHPLINEHENILVVKWVQASFREGDVEIIDWYLDDLWLKPDHFNREALWMNIEHWGRWQEIDPDALNKYLHVAVKKEAKRIKRDGEKKDKLTKNYKVIHGERLFPSLESNRFDNPVDIITRAEEIKIMLKLILELRENGSLREKQFIDLFLSGSTPSECLEVMGEKWSLYQSIQRKLKTKLKKFNEKRLVI